MIYKDLAFALRNLRRNKLLAFINVFGLAIGISACLVIFLIAAYEMSFDTFQPDKDRIYRVYSHFSGNYDNINHGVSTGIAAAMRANFTGLDAVSNFHTFHGKVEVPNPPAESKTFESHNKIIIADPDYFEVLGCYEWIIGNPQQSLSEPFKVVLTESKARLYFGDVDLSTVIGKEVDYNDSLEVSVSGIVKDIKKRTDFDFTDFISFATIEKSWLNGRISLNDWSGTTSSSQLFIKLSPGTTRAKIEEQIPGLLKLYKEHNKGGGLIITPTLQPLADIHFNPEVGVFDSSRSIVEKGTLQVMMLVAGLLLLIAVINFINLETAQASRRAREVGVRKVLGSSRAKLIARFLLETTILCFFAMILSVVFSFFALRFFSTYMPEGLEFDLSDPPIVLFLVGCPLAVALLAGLYPALVLSSYQPALALKNLAHGQTGTSRSLFVRKGLTVLQFSFAQIFIVGTIAIGLQIHYMLNKDLGFSLDSIIYFSTPSRESAGSRQALKNELLQISEIEMLSVQQAPPISGGWSSREMEYDNGKEIITHQVYLKPGDTSFLRLYNIPLLAGRNVVPVDTSNEYIINETYMRALGFTNPFDALGKTLDKKFTIVGVVSDFHTQSLQTEIKPTAILYRSDGHSFGIKLSTPHQKVSDLDPAIKKIEAAWKKIYPEEKFNYQFLSESVKNFYRTEQRVGTLVRTATGIAILISCLGLFGLSSFTVIQRTKEIGIRKVLGATVNSILVLLSWDFLKLVIIAFIVSVPVAWYLADEWLQKFAYHTDLTAWIFIASGLVSVAVALMTISLRTVDAAKADPVKALRYE